MGDSNMRGAGGKAQFQPRGRGFLQVKGLHVPTRVFAEKTLLPCRSAVVPLPGWGFLFRVPPDPRLSTSGGSESCQRRGYVILRDCPTDHSWPEPSGRSQGQDNSQFRGQLWPGPWGWGIRCRPAC